MPAEFDNMLRRFDRLRDRPPDMPEVRLDWKRLPRRPDLPPKPIENEFSRMVDKANDVPAQKKRDD